jgi:hypothetical protein
MLLIRPLFVVSAVLGALQFTLTVAAESAPAPAAAWHQTPFRIMASDAPLDTIDVGGNGHAAPFMFDLDGDSKRDLIVGSLAGRFFFYKNIGTDAAPAFGASVLPLKVGEQPAKVVNFCCMAAAPQFADIDGDGIADLTAGSYGGPVYFLKGLGGLQFVYPTQFLNGFGSTVVPNPVALYQIMPYFAPRGGKADSHATNVTWMAFNDDDRLDLILGNNSGQLFVWTAQEDNMGFSLPGMPLFNRMSLLKQRLPPMEFMMSDGNTPYPDKGPPNEITLNDEQVLPDGDAHSAPVAADWDGDGVCDLLVGSYSGRVYFLRNTGKPGAPQFKTRERLLDAGQRVQWLSAHADGGPGIRSQLQAADYNLDGKMDLLVGYYSESRVPRKNLTKAERKSLQGIREQLAQLNRQAGNSGEGTAATAAPRLNLNERAELLKQISEVEKRMIPLLEPVVKDKDSGEVKNSQQHGQVWVYLRR